MRLTPIETPRNPLLLLTDWLLRRRLGKTITPWKVIFARLPRTVPAQLGIYWGLERGLPLDPALQLLLQGHVAGINGCAFCLDIGRAMATRQPELLEKLDDVASFRTSPRFTERERAALAYVEEATRTRHVEDATFATLRQHFDEREIVAITWLNAVENYFNLLNVPLGIGADGLCPIAKGAPRPRLGAEQNASVQRPVDQADAVPRPAEPARQSVR
jgi:AhpD family alkylhydroperoxidase